MSAKVYITNQESRADYKVYFVDFDSRQQNERIIEGGKLVSSEMSADVVIYITNQESRATIKITRKNFPK